MARKPIKQYATLTDDLGADALSVATGGAVTAGSSWFTGEHTIISALAVSRGASYGSSSDATISVGGTDNGFVDAGKASAYRFKVSGNATGQSLSIQPFIRGSGWSSDYATCSSAGLWTLGPSSGTTDTIHTAQNRTTTTSSPVFNMKKGANDTTTSNKFITFEINNGASGSGQINANGASACAFGTYSDRRLKTNIIGLSGELSKILALNPVEFDYKTGGHQVGFIAQEMEEIYPDAINILGETEEMKTITGWDKTTARLVKAIQELSAKNDALEARLAALEAKP
jgi:hypothetical protein